MAKEQTFQHPPRGHVGFLAYDPVNDRFQVVHVGEDGILQVDVAASEALDARLHGYDGAAWQKLIVESETDPNLRVRLYGGSTKVNVALADADDRSPNYGALAVLGQLYGYDGAAWDRLRAEDQQLNVNLHGYDGSAWRKQPPIWAYSDRYAEKESLDNVSAGNHILTFSAVPAGEVWVVSVFNAWCNTSNPAYIFMYVYVGGVSHLIQDEPSVVGYHLVVYPGSIVLAAGDYLAVEFVTCALNDDIRAAAMGYKMSISQ